MLGTGYLCAIAAVHAVVRLSNQNQKGRQAQDRWEDVLLKSAVVGCESSQVQVESGRNYIFNEPRRVWLGCTAAVAAQESEASVRINCQ